MTWKSYWREEFFCFVWITQQVSESWDCDDVIALFLSLSSLSKIEDQWLKWDGWERVLERGIHGWSERASLSLLLLLPSSSLSLSLFFSLFYPHTSLHYLFVWCAALKGELHNSPSTVESIPCSPRVIFLVPVSIRSNYHVHVLSIILSSLEKKVTVLLTRSPWRHFFAQSRSALLNFLSPMWL